MCMQWSAVIVLLAEVKAARYVLDGSRLLGAEHQTAATAFKKLFLFVNSGHVYLLLTQVI